MERSQDSTRPREGSYTGSAARSSPPRPKVIGPYEILDQLGEGGMGVVYRARHATLDRVVALKTVQLTHESMLGSIRREIFALRSIDHPGVVRIVDDGVHEGLPWYAMDLLTGRTLRLCHEERRGRVHWSDAGGSGKRQAERRLGPADATMPSSRKTPPLETMAAETEVVVADRPAWPLEELLTLFYGICAALSAIHARGLVHRDLKPDNVFVLEDGTPVLVDFGLAFGGGALGREVLEVGGKLAGSPAYMSPEQVRGDLVDQRADFYALGCMLYEAIAGHVPFVGAVALMLEQHLHFPPQPPREFVPDVPIELERFVLRLLEKKPADRYAYVADVAAELVRLGAKPGRVTVPNVVPYLIRPSLAGRDEVLAELVDALVLRGASKRVFIGGESGAGKTRLAIELATKLGGRGHTVVAGRCAEVSGEEDDRGVVGAPLHLFAPLLQVIADRCRALGENEAVRILGDRVAILAPFQPAIAALVTDKTPSVPDLGVEAAKLRAITAMIETLVAFASTSPVLLLLDDLQWADELSLALLERLDSDELRRSSATIIGTYRTEEVPPSLERVLMAGDVYACVIGLLEPSSVARMVSEMLAIATPPARFIEVLHRESEGNPLFIAEYLRVAMDARLIHRSDAGAWTIEEAGEGARLPLPRSLQDLVLRRFEGTSPEARAIWRAGSAIGRELDADVLLAACGVVDVDEGRRIVNELRERQVLEEALGGRLRFVHDRLREIVYRSIPEAARPELHARVARALEATVEGGAASDRSAPDGSGKALCTELAHHYGVAGDRAKAFHYEEQSGHLAETNGAPLDAARAFERALAHLDRIDDEVVDGAPMWLVRGRLQRRLGSVSFQVGDIPGALRHERLALAHLSRRRARAAKDEGSRLGEIFFVVIALIGQIFRLLGLKRRLLKSPVDRARAKEISLAADCLSAALLFHDDANRAFGAALLSTDAAEGLGPCGELVRGYATLGVAFGFIPMYGVVRRYQRLAAKAAEEVQDRPAEAWMLRLKGLSELGMGRHASAIQALGASLSIERSIENRRGEQECLAMMANASQIAGDAPRALAIYDELVAVTGRHESRQARAWANSGSGASYLVLGDLDRAIACFEQVLDSLDPTGDVSEVIFFGAVASAYLHRGELDNARDVATSTLAVARKSGGAAYQCFVGIAATAEVFLALAERALGSARDELLGQAHAAVRALEKHASAFGISRASAHIHRGLYEIARGRKRRGVARLERSLAQAKALSTPFDEARALLELSRALPGERGAAKRAEAIELYERLGARDWAERARTSK